MPKRKKKTITKRKKPERLITTKVKKLSFFFGAGKSEGSQELKDLLGGKGAGLAEMTRIGAPVPPGFTISTEV